MQTSENYTMDLKVQLNRVKMAELAYIQLWAFCGRHLDGLTAFTPRKDNGNDKPVIAGPNPVLWQRLVRFTLGLGFRIPAAEQIAAQDSHSKLATEYLRMLTSSLSASAPQM